MKVGKGRRTKPGRREGFVSTVFLFPILALATAGAQDSAPENPSAPIQAQPVNPVPAGPRAVDPRPYEPPSSGGVPSQANQMLPGAPTNVPSGVTVSPLRMNSRKIEVFRPERVKVFPEDPESAWWEINPHYAFDRAQREQKPLLLLFTGIWNDQAMALSQEVFSTKSFNEFVKENLVICYLNYERSITDNPDSMRKIKERFKIKGYPNVLLFNPNGEVEKGLRGYRTGRPIDYFNRLRAATFPILESIEARKAELVRYGFRDWSNYLGKILFARFLAHDGTRVRLQDASGQKWIIKLNDLAPSDQKLVESFPAVDTLEDPDSEKP